jgi:UDPglucose--hexose-1-phosphate uridylyltransferase
MSEFSFIKNPLTKKWVISAPMRAKRPDVAKGTEPVCPFCPGKEKEETEFYRVGGEKGDANWQIRVIPNKFPFAPIHELIINTPDHHTSFDSFTKEHTVIILETYKHRFNEHSHAGQVYIFHNHGEKGGESIPHSHTQIAVIPDKVLLEIPRLQSVAEDSKDGIHTEHFSIFCPTTSVWPDEVWVAPQKSGRVFGEITSKEIEDFADILSKLTKIFDLRYNKDFPFNFYLYPGGDWYFRLIPRLKTLGGFEVGTNVFVNTQKPQETLEFIKEHFHAPNLEKILKHQQADYHHRV